MKNTVPKTIIGLCCLFFIGIFSCNKPKSPAKVTLTPLQTLVNSDTSLTWFHRLILQGNDAALLADAPVTLLIPTNNAFRQAGYVDTTIDAMAANTADRILRYQYITASLNPDTTGYTAYPTLLGVPVYVQKDKTGEFLFNGGATAPSTGTQVGQATIYLLSGPLDPAADSLPILLQTDTSLSFLAEAFIRTNFYDSVLLTGNHTLLAPVNNAFRQAGYDSVQLIDSADYNTIVQLLSNQVLKGAYFTNTFPNPGTVMGLQGGSITVGVAGGFLQFSGSGNAVPVNWLSGNQVGGPGLVVHRTDGLLSP